MDSLIFLVIMFLVGGVLQSLGKKSKEQRQRRRSTSLDPAAEDEGPKDILAAIREAMAAAERERQAAGQPQRIPLPEYRSPTTQHPSAEYRSPTTQHPAPKPARTSRPAPVDDEIFEEETESLEVDDDVQSLEDTSARPERVVVDYDEKADEVVQARIRWAEKLARPSTPEDHRAFDQRIRTTPPVVPAGESPLERHARLRQMLIWHEILGKPKAMGDF
ncbi:MAG: hypothetical protein ACKVZ0_21085 [Gemmatimonadales bacterium]